MFVLSLFVCFLFELMAYTHKINARYWKPPTVKAATFNFSLKQPAKLNSANKLSRLTKNYFEKVVGLPVDSDGLMAIAMLALVLLLR